MMYGWIIGLILIVFIIVAVGRGGFFQKTTGQIAEGNTNSSAMETLKNRYAKGEIDEEEFEKKKVELEKAN
ncbi:SHOCT domain-containing protein [Cyclobacterium roseum]|uniref:SHOCT domain-containing protein n=1 Tax=Cyclobacterium roseum TaxID=2666137 RepID=UPI0013915130|nr:SHOCT domain-containing protein [Cyclobacterium roseum]